MAYRCCVLFFIGATEAFRRVPAESAGDKRSPNGLRTASGLFGGGADPLGFPGGEPLWSNGQGTERKRFFGKNSLRAVGVPP